jgi:hypothetical protein
MAGRTFEWLQQPLKGEQAGIGVLLVSVLAAALSQPCIAAAADPEPLTVAQLVDEPYVSGLGSFGMMLLAATCSSG